MAEHGALKRCADTLTDLLQHQVVTISTSLLAKGLLNDDLHSWVLTAQGVSNKEKAARILASVMEQVKARTQSYGLFVEVLEGDAFYEDAVKKLSSEYRGSYAHPQTARARAKLSRLCKGEAAASPFSCDIT